MVAATPQPEPKTVRLGELCKSYLAEYPNRRSVKSKRTGKIEAAVALIVEFFGEDTPVSQITRQRCREFRDLLGKLPSNLSKHFPDRKLSLDRVIPESQRRDLPSLSWNTQEGYLGTLKDLVRWGDKEVGWNVDLDELRPVGEKTNPEEARTPFTTDQLIRIFSAPLFTSPAARWRGSTSVAGVTRYWTPLIGLFTGMRLNEICQLEVGDIKDADGIAYISVNADTPDKSVKTRHGKRHVPVHPELVRLGFLNLVQGRRDAGGGKLFPELARSERGYYSEDVSKWFSRTFLPSVGAKSKTTNFHSFRHTFRDALRRAEAPNEIVWALGGWSSGEGVSGEYGRGSRGYTIAQLHKWISLVQYPELVLTV